MAKNSLMADSRFALIWSFDPSRASSSVSMSWSNSTIGDGWTWSFVKIFESSKTGNLSDGLARERGLMRLTLKTTPGCFYDKNLFGSIEFITGVEKLVEWSFGKLSSQYGLFVEIIELICSNDFFWWHCFSPFKLFCWRYRICWSILCCIEFR